MASYRISGNTYQHRARIKEIGGRWNPERKEWIVEPRGTMRERAAIQAAVAELRKVPGVRVW